VDSGNAVDSVNAVNATGERRRQTSRDDQPSHTQDGRIRQFVPRPFDPVQKSLIHAEPPNRQIVDFMAFDNTGRHRRLGILPEPSADV
jgi:hypothetical protein